MPSRRPAFILAVLVATLAIIASGCSPSGSKPGTSVVGPCTADAATNGSCTPLSVGLGYIPSVQFAPFYLAETFQNRIDPDLVTLVGQGAVDVGVADGTSVIPAVSQGIPIRYIATIYGTYPSIVFAKASSGIQGPADLRGRRIGIPGRYGSSWIMLQALLKSVDLAPTDVSILEYPDFGQGVAVQRDAVDAATGFANNEPVQLEANGQKAVVLHVDAIVALPGPGLIASTSTLGSKQAAIRAFVAATLRAMNEIAQTPSKGLEASIAAVPELASSRGLQAAILDATIATWRGRATTAKGFGAIDRDGWTASIAYLTELGLVPTPVKVDALVTEDFLPGAQ